MEPPRRILVIKLGALGDLVLAFAPFAAIRARHPQAHITLLTTAPFAPMMLASPWFDAVAIDTRPPVWNLRGLLRLRRTLRGGAAGRFDFVYDLQTSGRSSRYHRLAGRPAWSGIARGASHPHDNPGRDALHTRARQADQLARAGIASVPFPDLSWLAARPAPALPAPAVLLVPGAAPHRPAKRWPAERFGALAAWLAAKGLHPVVVGAAGDAPLAAAIRAACPEAVDLTGKTSLLELGGVAAHAVLAVGNDTGPMHLAAALGCPSLVLFSHESDPALTVPMHPDGRPAAVLRVPDLGALPVADVVARVAGLLP